MAFSWCTVPGAFPQTSQMLGWPETGPGFNDSLWSGGGGAPLLMEQGMKYQTPVWPDRGPDFPNSLWNGGSRAPTAMEQEMTYQMPAVWPDTGLPNSQWNGGSEVPAPPPMEQEITSLQLELDQTQKRLASAIRTEDDFRKQLVRQKLLTSQTLSENSEVRAGLSKLLQLLAPGHLPSISLPGLVESCIEKAAKQEQDRQAACEELAAAKAAAEELAGAAKVAVPVTEASGADWASRIRHACGRIRNLAEAILPVVQQAQKAEEVLATALTCSLSHDIFRKPLFAPDGQAYEAQYIRAWLLRQPVSPFTKQSMRTWELLRDRVLEQAVEALWLLRGKEGPKDQQEPELSRMEEVQREEARPSQAPSHVRRLRRLIAEGNEAGSLEMLQESEEMEWLNEQKDEEGPEDGATVLHLALLSKLPAVAIAIAKHPCFEKHEAGMGQRERITTLHLAAALGFNTVCKALIEHCGAAFCADEVKRSVTLELQPDGGELNLQRGQDALDLAKLHGHAEAATFLKETIKTYLSQLRG